MGAVGLAQALVLASVDLHVVDLVRELAGGVVGDAHAPAGAGAQERLDELLGGAQALADGDDAALKRRVGLLGPVGAGPKVDNGVAALRVGGVRLCKKRGC